MCRFLHLRRIAPFLLLGGGALFAQAPIPERATFDIAVAEKVEFQVVDAKGRYTGMDFQAKVVQIGLPDTTYDAYEGLDNDVTGQPDPDPIQHFDGFFEQAQQYILRFHPKAYGSFHGAVIVSDQQAKSRRIKFMIVAKKDLAIQEYQLVVDPLNVHNCRLAKIRR